MFATQNTNGGSMPSASDSDTVSAAQFRGDLGENLAHVPFVQRNDPFDALAPRGADQPFAIRVRMRPWRGRRTSSDIDLRVADQAAPG